MTRFILVDLNPDEHSPRLHYYPFMVSLDGCNGSCNIPVMSLTPPASSISESYIEIKIKLYSYFHTFLWSLKRFRRTTKKCENKNST